MGGTGGMGGMGGGGMGGGGMGGAGGGGPSVKVNGCDSATAQDETANAAVKITYGADLKYTPACIRVKKGTDITFEGTFSMHPLVGGDVGPPPVPDSASPIKATNGGNAVTFTMDLAGAFPYYCEYHLPSMAGAVFVE
jgi:plastocyanin